MYKFIFIIIVVGLCTTGYYYKDNLYNAYQDTFDSESEALSTEIENEIINDGKAEYHKIDISKEAEQVAQDIMQVDDKKVIAFEDEKEIAVDVIKKFEKYNLILQNLESLILKVSLHKSCDSELQYLLKTDSLDIFKVKTMLDLYNEKYINSVVESDVIFPSNDSLLHKIFGKMVYVEKIGGDYVDMEKEQEKILLELVKIHDIVYSEQFIKQILLKK